MNHNENFTVPPSIMEEIGESGSVLLTGHTDPDGDCIGSQLALASFLRRLGKEAYPLAELPFRRDEINPFQERFLENIPEFKKEQDTPPDLLIVLDVSTQERLGRFSSLPERYPTIIIDHHASGTPFGRHQWIEPTAASVTLMIYTLIRAMGEEIEPEEAQFLFLGLATDTGFFRHLDGKGGAALKAAGELTSFGASPKEIYSLIYGNRSLASRKFLGKLLDRAETVYNGQVLFTYEYLKDQREFGKEERDSDSLYQQLFGVAGVEVVVYIRQEQSDRCSVGLRSKHRIDVGTLAREYGGGGHPRAAGFETGGSVRSVRNSLYQHLAQVSDFTEGEPV